MTHLFTGRKQPTFCRDYNPFPKYQQDIPVESKQQKSIGKNFRDINIEKANVESSNEQNQWLSLNHEKMDDTLFKVRVYEPEIWFW